MVWGKTYKQWTKITKEKHVSGCLVMSVKVLFVVVLGILKDKINVMVESQNSKAGMNLKCVLPRRSKAKIKWGLRLLS